ADRQNLSHSFELPTHAFSLHKKPISLAEYQRGFDLVQRELQKGNTYLLNLTYPTEIETNYNLQQLFQQSRARYKLLYQDQFVCFSPECFVRIEQDKIYTYPMKGTIDAALKDATQCLLKSEKELSEHYTIVDLMRNDLAVVAERIEVSRFRYVEQVQTEQGAILQTSSEIYGHLPSDWHSRIGSILEKLLPAGSISGAPKAKTVNIIRQAERRLRGYYTGIFGIFSGHDLQSAVAIRYIEQQNGKLYFHSGGGITRQSQLEEEYLELQQKVYVPLINKD
ncbi:MAG TPA: aminodeoxychorismate synthase component I, partial [Pasteurellaceae bacterium]|nr:aminodeoxychorismate synthase component I [Pasteurellaceae bacterium]